MTDPLIKITREYMSLSEQEMFEIADSTRQSDEDGKSLSLWWLAIPCLMSVCILVLLITSYPG